MNSGWGAIYSGIPQAPPPQMISGKESITIVRLISSPTLSPRPAIQISSTSNFVLAVRFKSWLHSAYHQYEPGHGVCPKATSKAGSRLYTTRSALDAYLLLGVELVQLNPSA